MIFFRSHLPCFSFSTSTPRCDPTSTCDVYPFCIGKWNIFGHWKCLRKLDVSMVADAGDGGATAESADDNGSADVVAGVLVAVVGVKKGRSRHSFLLQSMTEGP